MFNFFSEIKEKCGNLADKVVPYKMVVLGGNSIYVEGNITLMTFAETSIVFKVPNNIIIVSGKCLQIKEITQNTLVICGSIVSWEKV